MDVDAVRAFVAVVDAGQFQAAAADLGLTQQGVSKRVAALEGRLGARLLHRTARGARPTIDGQAFLPHARALLGAADRAAASVSPARRVLRVDVIGRRLAPAGLLREFHLSRPDIELDVVTLFNADEAVAAVAAGTVDATFRAVGAAPRRLPDGVVADRVLDEPLHLLVGPGHPLARAAEVTPARLVGHRIWIPGIAPGTEWAAYYDDLARDFSLTIDAVGPDFGIESMMDTLAETRTLATLIGEGTRLLWPAGHDLRRIPVRRPVPAYPHALVRRSGPAAHPGADSLLAWLLASRPPAPAGSWTPDWAR